MSGPLRLLCRSGCLSGEKDTKKGHDEYVDGTLLNSPIAMQVVEIDSADDLHRLWSCSDKTGSDVEKKIKTLPRRPHTRWGARPLSG